MGYHGGMGPRSRHVLVLSGNFPTPERPNEGAPAKVDESAAESIMPMLGRSDFQVYQALDSDRAIKLIQCTAFDLLIADYPLPGFTMSQLLAAVRGPLALCRHSGLMLLVDPQAMEEAKAFVGRGVNQVVDRSDRDRVLKTVAALLEVSPRVAVRAMVRFESRLECGDQPEVTETENVSLSGMLVHGGRDIPVGSRIGFELHLPGKENAICGSAQIVRRTDPDRESIAGMAACFESIEDDGLLWLARYLGEIGSAGSY